jgi:pimeloyl-ACP methyl ester carboxylesterase
MLFFLKLIAYVLLLFFVVLAGGFIYTRWQSAKIAHRYPNIGQLTDIGGFRMNSVHWPRPETVDLPPLVFIHGASGNLRDQSAAFLEPLKTRAEMLFVDRPGHGYSERGGLENLTQDGQADAIARLMAARGISRAIMIGHSFGGATVAAFALRHPEKVAGLLFLSPATHPWKGGIDWYYHLATMPVIGPVFCNTLVAPIARRRIERAVAGVFHPNPVPEGYVDAAAIPLLLRPGNFRDNAFDVANLLGHVRRTQPRYKEIDAPTIVITGDTDEIVYEELHSRGLKRDVPGAELYWVRGLGHKPDYAATDLAIAAIEKLSGFDRDLMEAVRVVERRLDRA